MRVINNEDSSDGRVDILRVTPLVISVGQMTVTIVVYGCDTDTTNNGRS